jgi:dihydropteroate synthase
MSLELGRVTRVVGILNVTPDSFSDGGRFLSLDAALARGEAMAAAGADLLDVGGQSTRPGSSPVPAEEEISRVIPVIRGLRPLGIPLSVDTTRVVVAREALEAGASAVNDISGLRFEPGLADLARERECGLILMHSRRSPQDMQRDPRYDDVVREVGAELKTSRDRAMAAGVAAEALVVDPGLGFAKSLDHNLELLRGLDRLGSLGRPILVGASRKSFIGLTLDLPVDDRLEGSVAVAVAAVLAGAHIVRVHDVRETKRAVLMADAILGSGN